MKNRAKINKINFLINIFFAAVTICCLLIFCGKLFEKKELLAEMKIGYIILIFVTAVLVHTIKALRFYIVMFGHKFKLRDYIPQYIKTAVVNMLLPFKSGEVYRGYCMGRMIDSIADGYIMVIFDRFIDTLALISLVICLSFFTDVEITEIYMFLSVFLVVVIIIYNLFKPLYQYWNHFLIFNKSSEHTLVGLQFLKACNDAFMNINFVVKGRFVMLYLLSLVAWSVEIGMLVTVGKQISGMEISTYLSDVLTGNLNVNNMMYTIQCFVFFLIVGIVLFINRLIKEK